MLDGLLKISERRVRTVTREVSLGAEASGLAFQDE